MSSELETRARQAAAGLNAAVDTAPLHHHVDAIVATSPRRVPMRVALVAAALFLFSAAGLALVADRAPGPISTPTTVTPTTLTPAPTTTLRVTETTLEATVLPPSTTTTLPADTTPPDLLILSPKNGAEVHKQKIEVSGTTEPGASLRYRDRTVEVGSDGHWSLVVDLAKGKNELGFIATDRAGNAAGASITVFYAPPPPETTTTTTEPKPDKAAFEAHAAYGTCTLTPPFDVYYGKGEPGTVVHIQSEYGSGSVEVNGEGQWEIQVYFPEAPENITFPVKAKDDLGRETIFEFTYLPEG